MAITSTFPAAYASDTDSLFISDVVKTIESTDIESISAEFVYNYFQRDENENGVTTPVTSSTDFEKLNIPRYIKIQWYAGSAIMLTGRDGVLPGSISGAHQAGLVNYEEDEKSSRYTAVNLQDTNSNYDFYNKYITDSNSLVSIDVSQPISDSAFGYSTTYKNNAINDMNSLSLSVIISNEISDLVTDRIKKNELSPFYNDVLASDSNRTESGWNRARDDADRLLNSREIIPYSEHYITNPDDPINHQHEVILVGFIIEKRESTYNNVIITHDNIFIESFKTNEFLDINVKYGSLYQYYVRAVYDSRFYSVSDSDSTSYTYSEYRAIIASKGSEDIQVLAREFDPPKPPENLQFRFYSGFDSLRIGWDYPHIRTRDVKRVQIYRRSSIKAPFELLKEYDFDDSGRKEFSPASGNESNITIIEKTLIDTDDPSIPGSEKYIRIAPGFYYDVEFNENSNYIYALATIDAHGLTSKYSDQFEVSYNKLTNKVKTNYISPAGAMKSYPNELLEIDMLPDVIKGMNYSYMNVHASSEFSSLEDPYEELYTTEHGSYYRESDDFIMSGSYKIQAISVEQQQSDLFEFKIKN